MSSLPVRHGNTIIFPASLDPKAVSVVRRLGEAGFESYLVGGCVRDLLLGRIPKDFDVSTEARPRQIRRVFRNCRIIGRRFKLAHVHFGEQIIEVATFRRNPAEASEVGEDDEEPGDEPEGQETDDLLITRDNVYGTAEEDIRRRDFTMNALLYDVASEEVIDYVGGFEDLQQRVVRTIGDPAVRLAEDPVRMLRAVKFTSRLDLQLDPGLDAAMRASADLISRSAPPRVLEEIYKLLTCGRAERSLDMLAEYGLLQRLVPEVAGHWAAHRAELAAVGRALDAVDGGLRRVGNAFLLAALFHDPWRSALPADEGADTQGPLRDLLAPAAVRMNIPRRDVAIVKQLLSTQLRLERPRRSRRFRMGDFLGRTSTQEAIDLLYVRSLSGGADPELHATWAERVAHSHRPAPTRGPTSRDGEGREASGPGRRRSRRGGRRRRGRGQRGEERPEPVHAAAPDDVPRTSDAPPARVPGVPTPVGEATPSAEASPAGLKGLVRSWFQRILGGPDEPAADETPAAARPEAATPAGPARAAPEAGPATDQTPAHAADDGDEADAAGEGPSRRRRRRRRGRGRGSRTEGAPAAATREADDRPAPAEGDDAGAPMATGSSRSRRRRRTRRGRGRGTGGPDGAGPRAADKPSRSRRRSTASQPDDRPDRGSRADSADSADSEQVSTRSGKTAASSPRHHPEDVEDIFDW